MKWKRSYMTVAEVIKELKKFPPNGLVGIQDHDSDELASIVMSVVDFDADESSDPEYCQGVVVAIGG